MKEYRTVPIDETTYTLLISDEQEALLAAQAAGGAVLGLWDPGAPEEAPWGVPFLAEKGAPLDGEYLERIVRRQKGLPWIIASSDRLRLREFTEKDWEAAAELGQEADCPGAFCHRETFLAYIRNQYPFYEYGIWAAEEKTTGILLGAAGVWDMPDIQMDPPLELGYWIRRSFRNQGYGREAAEAAVSAALERLTDTLYLRIRRENHASRRLAEKLGFRPLPANTLHPGQAGQDDRDRQDGRDGRDSQDDRDGRDGRDSQDDRDSPAQQATKKEKDGQAILLFCRTSPSAGLSAPINLPE